MKFVIYSIRKSLKTMIDIHQESIALENKIPGILNHPIRKRINQIYFDDAPQVLAGMLRKLKLIKPNENYSQYDVMNAWLYFSRHENILRIIKALNENYELQKVENQMVFIDDLASEMESGLTIMQSTVNEKFILNFPWGDSRSYNVKKGASNGSYAQPLEKI